MSLIELNRKNRIGYVTLNRPEKRNALSPELIEDLKEGFNQLSFDDTVKVVVLRANGEVFCAGADLAYLQAIKAYSYDENLEDSNKLKELYKLIYGLEKPVIAQVGGHAIAGGAGLAGVCDYIFAVPEAKFGYTEVKIGFVPALVSIFLVTRIGEGRAREILMSGQLYEAAFMEKIGAITQVIPVDHFAEYVEEFADKLARENSATSMKLTKQLINKLHGPLDQSLDVAAEINARSRGTADFQKGISAFLEKKRLNW